MDYAMTWWRNELPIRVKFVLLVLLANGLPARLFAAAGAVVSLVVGFGLIYQVETVNQYWPWTMPPLVGGLILFTTHAAAYAWSLWDDDWVRVRPMYWQAPITGVLLMLLPLTHSGDLRPDSGAPAVLRPRDRLYRGRRADHRSVPRTRTTGGE